MANRLNGDVIIVDSAMGNVPIIGANSAITNFRISAISFFASDTSSVVRITGANTSLDVYFASNIISIGTLSNNGSMIHNPQQVVFPGGLRANNLKVPALTAGTAYIYLI